MRTLIAVLFAITMMTVVGVGFVVMRPVYVEVMEALKSVIYDMDISTLTQEFLDLKETSDYLYWLIPAFIFIVLVVYVWMTAQQKEYVTGGEYF